MEKRMFETLMSKESVEFFILDINDLKKVRKKDGTFYVYKEEINV